MQAGFYVLLWLSCVAGALWLCRWCDAGLKDRLLRDSQRVFVADAVPLARIAERLSINNET
jgi:hypothetical protein